MKEQLRQLGARGVPPGMIEQLTKMGLAASPILEKLVAMNDIDFERVVAAFSRVQIHSSS